MNNLLEIIYYLDSGIGILYFAVLYILLVVFILPASWLSLLAGFLYGPYLGTLIIFISAFIGASFSFLLSKKFFSFRIEKIINKFSKLSILEKIINRGGLKLIMLTRLSPIFPFSLLNYFYGLNKISYKDFSISLVCILPGSYLYSSLGDIANNINEIQDLRVDNNIIINLVSIISTALVIYFLAKYANEIIKESSED
ncbi:MAG: TVP38/TMEM64 family protein [Prochlorococcus sp. SP3034]|nr:TVP38/TMEM64 family protein [Prochlorococcus sp. SP3034]|tara:strand:- start:11260 stop:11853 length:594 start_codon:yes stop_codon:yes gene_type:complete